MSNKPRPKTTYDIKQCLDYISEAYGYSPELKAEIASSLWLYTITFFTAEEILAYNNGSMVSSNKAKKKMENFVVFLNTLIKEFGEGVYYE